MVNKSMIFSQSQDRVTAPAQFQGWEGFFGEQGFSTPVCSPFPIVTAGRGVFVSLFFAPPQASQELWLSTLDLLSREVKSRLVARDARRPARKRRAVCRLEGKRNRTQIHAIGRERNEGDVPNSDVRLNCDCGTCCTAASLFDTGMET